MHASVVSAQAAGQGGISVRWKGILQRTAGPLLCLACASVVFQPFLASGLPNSADGLVHVYRAALWRWAWSDGILWPRWSTLLFQGYGYPVLQFNPPLLYAGAGLLSFLTANILTGFKAVLFLACLSYTLSMYSWARAVLGQAGGIVAAVAYTFATFRFRELYFQGNYQQFLAWSLYPWALFFFLRLASKPARRYFAGAVLSLAAVLLTHTISAMLFTPVLAVYAIALALHYRRHSWRYLLAAGGLAGGLAAIYLLPAFMEQHYTQVSVLTQGFFDVGTHFLHWQELLAPTPELDIRAANPVMPNNFGPLHLLLAAAGAITIVLHKQERARRLHMLMAAGGLFMCVAMMLPLSRPVWQAVPMLGFAEFPARMYGPAFLFSSLLAGAAVVWLQRWPRWQWLAVGGISLGLIVAVAPYQFPRPFMQVDVTPAALVAAETDLRMRGTTSADEFLGVWAATPPQSPAISRDLARQALVDPPAGVSASVTASSAQSLRLSVDAAEPADVTVAQFYFPGWQARVDGAPVAITPAPDSGLIQLSIGAGQHDVQLDFGQTPVRTGAAAVSCVALIILLVAILRIPWPAPEYAPPTTSAENSTTARPVLALAAVLALLLVTKAAWIEPHTSWWRVESPPGAALPATHTIQATLGGKIALLGYDIGSPTVRQGDQLMIRLYWQALTPLDKDYSSFVHLTAGPEQTMLAQSDAMHPGYIPSTLWHPSLYNVDEQWVAIPRDAPAVGATVIVGLYDQSTGEVLGTVTLPDVLNVLPAHAITANTIPVRSTVQFGEQIRLLGYGITVSNEQIELTLYWQAASRPAQDYQVFVHLNSASGAAITQSDGTPVGGLYPTSRWLAGQIIADVYYLSVPTGSRPATLSVGLYDLNTMARLPARKPDGSLWPDGALSITLPQ